MSAPLSNKAAAGGIGALTGGGTTIAIVELLGQLPGMENANQNVVRALGSIIVVLGAMFGSRWMSWWKKESDEFITYAAGESGKVLVDAGTKLGVPAPDLAALEQKIDALGAQLESKVQSDAEKLLQHYFPTSTGVVVTQVPPTTTSGAVQADEQIPPAADPVLTDTHTTTVTDPVLADDYTPTADTDPVLAN